jgi:diguanylate cyclase (GGDEF)-like protein
VSTALFRRLSVRRHRGEVPSGNEPAPPRVGLSAGRARAGDTDQLTARSSLRDMTAAIPGLRERLIERARGAGLLVGSAAVVVVPLWTVVDSVLAPNQVGTFLVVRLACDIPMLLALWALWRLPVGRRQPERLTYLILFVIQGEVAWMALRVQDVGYYLLGFTVAIYLSGCVLVARPRWTGRLVAVSWGSLLVSALTTPQPLRVSELVAVGIYVGTASLVAVLAHVRRYALSNQGLLTRARLEHEQKRTAVLLARLERLSHEDPLTGLANRRRWDGELAEACDAARTHGGSVGVVLLDLDHFKMINDRYGHGGGDAALRDVAALLADRVREGDLVARLGGDELAVLMPGADLDRAEQLAERLREEATRLQPPGFSTGELTLSLGVAAASGATAFPVELMSRADGQLYRAKITRNAVASPRDQLPCPRQPGLPTAAEAVRPAPDPMDHCLPVRTADDRPRPVSRTAPAAPCGASRAGGVVARRPGS